MNDDERRKFLESMGYKVAPKAVTPKLREIGDTSSSDYDPKKVKKADRNPHVDRKELLALGKIFQVKPEKKPAVFIPPEGDLEDDHS